MNALYVVDILCYLWNDKKTKAVYVFNIDAVLFFPNTFNTWWVELKPTDTEGQV
jgi:hypothetical protein